MDREQAIDLLDNLIGMIEDNQDNDYDAAFRMAINTLKQPKQQEGHWIPHESPDGGEQYECSRCGVLWEFNDGTPEDNEAYFCPKCGKKLITK